MKSKERCPRCGSHMCSYVDDTYMSHTRDKMRLIKPYLIEKKFVRAGSGKEFSLPPFNYIPNSERGLRARARVSWFHYSYRSVRIRTINVCVGCKYNYVNPIIKIQKKVPFYSCKWNFHT